ILVAAGQGACSPSELHQAVFVKAGVSDGAIGFGDLNWTDARVKSRAACLSRACTRSWAGGRRHLVGVIVCVGSRAIAKIGGCRQEAVAVVVITRLKNDTIIGAVARDR